jgi:His-Xaa-Ser system radical SAM maturase HxsB
MSAETASRIVHVIFKTRSKSIKIEFQGGEPTLRFDLVQNIVLEAEQLNRVHRKHLAFVLCTNLVAITEAQLEFLKDHGVCISTSLDGPKAIHDANRPLRDGSGSYDIVVRNLDRARTVLGEGSVSALMTVTPNNLYRFVDVIREYRQRGLSSIFIRPLNPYGRARTNGLDRSYTVRQFTAQYIAALEEVLSVNRAGYSIVEEYAALLLERILTPFGGGFVDLQSPAGCGISGALYNYDGNVYVSDEGRMLAEMGDHKFLMGNVHDHEYGEIFGGPLIRELVSSSIIESVPGCAWCVYCPYCGTDPVRNYAEGGEIAPRAFQNEACRKNMMIFRHLFDLLRSGDNTTHDVLWSWATRRPLHEISLGN